MSLCAKGVSRRLHCRDPHGEGAPATCQVPRPSILPAAAPDPRGPPGPIHLQSDEWDGAGKGLGVYTGPQATRRVGSGMGREKELTSLLTGYQGVVPNPEHSSWCTEDPKPTRRETPPWGGTPGAEAPRVPGEGILPSPGIKHPSSHPGIPRPVTSRGRECPQPLQRAAPANPVGTVCVPLRAPIGDTRAPGPGRCRSATQALPYRV